MLATKILFLTVQFSNCHPPIPIEGAIYYLRRINSGWGGVSSLVASNGGADGIRTHDLLDAIEARSQLRHGPTDWLPPL
jgi:hypothetical protein